MDNSTTITNSTATDYKIKQLVDNGSSVTLSLSEDVEMETVSQHPVRSMKEILTKTIVLIVVFTLFDTSNFCHDDQNDDNCN